MKFSYNWLQSFLDKKLPTPESLSEMLTKKLFEIEKIEKKENDWLIDIKVLPNRAGDCFSHIGIAREIAAMIRANFKEPKIGIKEDKKIKIEEFVSVKVVNPDDCSRYVARAVIGVKVGPSPKWIKERLAICGIQSINNVVDIANYVMLETGQPLHIFDLNKIAGVNPKSQIKKIIIRRAEKDEKIITLDGKEYNLDEDILTIADTKKLLGIAGIKGGKEAEILNNTKNIVIESASFNRKIIRKGSAKLKIRTDASIRFEHGFDPNLSESAIKKAALLIQEIASGKIARGMIDFYPKKNLPKKILLNVEQIKSVLGVEIKKETVKKILKILGFKIVNKNDNILNVEIPTQRTDIHLEEDLIEEIGRIIGYDKILAIPPQMETVSPQKNSELFWEDNFKNLFRAVGFSEIYNYSFINEEQTKLFTLPASQFIEVESPVSIEQKYLRHSLAPHLFKNIKENEKFFDNIKIFELGKVFAKKLNAVYENKSLAGVMTGDSFFHLKGVLELVLKEAGIKKINYVQENTNEAPFLELNKKARILINSVDIGYLGVSSLNIRKKMKIDSQFSIFEVNFNKITEMAKEEKQYLPLAKFPETTRDLAILVPLETSFQEVFAKIKNCGPKFLKDINLFDIYQGKNVPEDKKSFALRLTYRGDRTLTTEEVNQFQKKIIEYMEADQKWLVRK